MRGQGLPGRTRREDGVETGGEPGKGPEGGRGQWWLGFGG